MMSKSMISTIPYNEIINMKPKFNRAITFLLSKALFEYQGVMILNLLRTNKNTYDVIILFEYDLTDEQKEFLVNLEPKCLFVHYTKQDFYDELSISESIIPSMRNVQHLHTQYGKHVIFKLLNICNKVLLLEQDMIINGDISEIFTNEGPAIAGVMNYEEHFKNSLGISTKVLEEELPKNITASNAGFYYVDNSIPYKTIYEFLVNFKKRLLLIKKDFFITLDELAINYSLYKYCSNIRVMPKHDWNLAPIFSTDSTKLIHCKYGMKQNLQPSVLFLFPQWLSAYREWISLGGHQIKGVDLNQYSGYVKNAFINEYLIHMLYDILNLNISFLKLINEYDQSKNLTDLFDIKSHLNFLYKNKFTISINFVTWAGCHTFVIKITYKNKNGFDEDILEHLRNSNIRVNKIDNDNIVLTSIRSIYIDKYFKNYFLKIIKILDTL